MSLIIGQYYRGDPRLKPAAYGPASAVRASIFKNAERAGIPLPCSFVPTWENAGNKVLDYLYNVQGTKQGNWKNNALTELDGNNRVNVTIPSVLDQGDSDSAVFSFEFHGVIASNFANTYAFWTQAGGGTPYSAIRYTYSTEKFSVFSYNGEFSTTGTYGDYTSDFPATHFVFTIDSPNNEISIYADGKLLEIIAGTAQWPREGGSINYGGKPDTSGIIRRLDYAKLWHNVILSPDQVAYSHDNPYFLLQRQAPVFYSIPDDGTGVNTINVNSSRAIEKELSLTSSRKTFRSSVASLARLLFNTKEVELSRDILKDISVSSSRKMLNDSTIETSRLISSYKRLDTIRFILGVSSVDTSREISNTISLGLSRGIYAKDFVNITLSRRLLSVTSLSCSRKVTNPIQLDLGRSVKATKDLITNRRILDAIDVSSSREIRVVISLLTRRRIGDAELIEDQAMDSYNPFADFIYYPFPDIITNMEEPKWQQV